MKRYIPSIAHKKLCGTTMAELLVVMIVSGILFLLLFDGLRIVQQYGRILDRKLTAKSGLLYSHQVLETLMGKTDSICINGQELLFYTGNAAEATRIGIDSTCMVLYGEGTADTLFAGLIDAEVHTLPSHPSGIDSIFLSVCSGRDTVRLDYGLSPYSNLTRNEFATDDIDE